MTPEEFIEKGKQHAEKNGGFVTINASNDANEMIAWRRWRVSLQFPHLTLDRAIMTGRDFTVPARLPWEFDQNYIPPSHGNTAQERALLNGLPRPETTEQRDRAASGKAFLRSHAERLGLPPDASPSEIWAAKKTRRQTKEA